MREVRQILGSITGRGQVTLPAEVRRLLGVHPGGKLVFEIEGTQVRLRRPAFTLESAYRSIPPLLDHVDVEEIIEQAKEERAQACAWKMQDR